MFLECKMLYLLHIFHHCVLAWFSMFLYVFACIIYVLMVNLQGEVNLIR